MSENPYLSTQFDERQQQLLQDNAQFVSEREREIIGICQSISELADIFRELNTLIIDQGTILDNIAYNVEQTQYHVEESVKELVKAEKLQKCSRKMMCILVIVILLIFLVFLLIFLKRTR